MMQIKEISCDTLEEYFAKEKAYLLTIGANYSHGLLDTAENKFSCISIKALYVNEEMCGFYLVPKYDTRILMRLYISHTKRSLGYGSFILSQHPELEHLCCLTENSAALRFYLNNGFVIIRGDKLTSTLGKP
jgi:GNAT superfamily N-acetyltransferase